MLYQMAEEHLHVLQEFPSFLCPLLLQWFYGIGVKLTAPPTAYPNGPNLNIATVAVNGHANKFIYCAECLKNFG